MYSHQIWRFLFHRVPFREKARMHTPFAFLVPLLSALILPCAAIRPDDPILPTR